MGPVVAQAVILLASRRGDHRKKQYDLGRTDFLVSFDMARTAQKMKNWGEDTDDPLPSNDRELIQTQTGRRLQWSDEPQE